MDVIPQKKEVNLPGMNPVEFPRLFELKEQPMDVLIALGHNWDRTKPWVERPRLKPEPSLATKITAISSYLLLALGVTKKVIYSGGSTIIGNPYTESEAMLDYVKKVISGNGARELSPSELSFIDNGIRLEKKSYDTHTNAIESKELIEELKNETGGYYIRKGLMTMGFHLDGRAADTFWHSKVWMSDELASEELLAETLKYINFHLREISLTNPFLAEQFIRIRLEIRLLLQEFNKKRVLDRLGVDGVKPYFKVHGQIYHRLARIYQNIKRDPSGKKISAMAYAQRVKTTTPETNETTGLKAKIQRWLKENVTRKP